MKAKLCFRDDPNGGHDAIAFLAPEGAVLDNATYEMTDADFDGYVRDALGATNRSREINIVDSLDAARTLVAKLSEDHNARSIITDLGGCFSVGSTHFDGSYDSGFPVILDMRNGGEPIELHEDLIAGGVAVEKVSVSGPMMEVMGFEATAEPTF